MRLASIHTYPVKSCHRLDHDDAVVEPWGLAGDRRWLVVEPDGTFITQRAEPALALVQPSHTGEGGLLLRTPGMPDLDVPAPAGGDLMAVRVWRSTVDATPAGSAADDWLSTLLDRKVRLVYLDDPTRRSPDQKYARPGDRVSFADGYPLLLANSASLDAVNDWLVEAGEEPVPMTRFRPNVVVGGAPAWAEDEWLGRRIRVGEVAFRVAKPCGRCVMTTIDQETAERGRQPLRVLGRRRRFAAGLLFGVNLIPDRTGTIAVGDPVEVDAPAVAGDA
ncbi:MOSC domain-containing protein [Planosporangium thailandense]|uniref:MOSC domain-containing protein n=1 Tax=Planosporangium thailandense TaxID=765197 RepID=A0ABX0Y5M3_9ACTN|nr:MOSC N-terminal beta barrel domain-containing protein [Planosporangium thailandense]NJC73709.1 MOSC domain-containing protein [Planosporangium thailandense]